MLDDDRKNFAVPYSNVSARAFRYRSTTGIESPA
jgi:hypothetical protein